MPTHLPENRIPTHPGEILGEEFLIPLGKTPADLARHIGVNVAAIEDLIAGRSGMTAALAWGLSMAFDTSPEFWLNLQAAHDLAATRPTSSIGLLAV
ncbi:MAG: HigA family addiction module antidote protein [Dehalococcoidia bacterium]|nr:HigA family addiction module antidote protein [Dehalococcoidia bacterium]